MRVTRAGSSASARAIVEGSVWPLPCPLDLRGRPAASGGSMAVRAQQPESVTHVGGVDYKLIALSNTTLGILTATLNPSIVLIALPTIFTGIRINPLTPGNT